MWKDAFWLKVPEEEIKEKGILHGDMTGRFAYFRCEKMLPEGARLTTDISANSRYRLWVNEKPVLSGPCKGDTWRQYYETVDLTAYLREGKNVFCAQVLYNDPGTAEIQTDDRAAIYGVIGQLCGHRFALEGDVTDASGVVLDTLTTGKADWRVFLDGSFHLTSTDITCYLGAAVEEIDFRKCPVQWKSLSFDMCTWRKAIPADTVPPTNILYGAGVQPRFRMREREIPLLFEREGAFARCFHLSGGEAVTVYGEGSPCTFTVPAGETLDLVFDAGEILNAYPRFSFAGGSGTEVAMTYFEKFGGPGSDLRRDDWQHGEAIGLTDRIVLNGEPVIYEPFWVRCFRFVRIRIAAGCEDVRMKTPAFRRTGYPLKIESSIRSSVPWVERLWKLCVNTLQNCMMETYMDCPYYEQLQFAMDTRLEALFTYTVTGDTRLAKKALIDFHYGMQPEGLTAGKYPSAYLQILSSFSLHYIFLMKEYYEQTGDAETVRLIRGDVDRILDYYDAHLGEDGLLGRLGFWEFVDWQDAWAENAGMPTALKEGPSTILNLMYAYALSCGEEIYRKQNRPGIADEYVARRNSLLARIQETCFDEEKGLYREGPGYEQYSQHAQAWAVLTGLVSGEETRALLRRTIAASAGENPSCLKVTFSTAYEWFRALEIAGLGERIRKDLDDWIGLPDLGCTACPETPVNARSDCHAWSALPMFEMTRTMAGIRELPDGTIRVAPHLFDLQDLAGEVVTKNGIVRFDYRIEGKRLRAEVEIPEGGNAVFVCPDGRTEKLAAGKNYLTEEMAAEVDAR